MSKVADYWHTEDVHEANKMQSNPVELNEDEANAVLLLACVAKHNAEVGVNWDVLKAWIDEIKDSPEDVEQVLANYGRYLEPEGKPKVVIEVQGGVAEVTSAPDNIDVEIIDHDNSEEL